MTGLAQLAVVVGHTALALAAVGAVALLGRLLSTVVRQPAVVLEIVLGLGLGAVVVLGGAGDMRTLLPAPVLANLTFVGHVGLVLLLVGLAHEMCGSADELRWSAAGRTATAALLVPLAIGAGLALWILTAGGPELRGTAPPAALVLLVAVSLGVSAVPVLARVLDDRGITGTRAGRLSLASAVIMDIAAWPLVALAIGLAAGGSGGFLRLVLVTLGGIAGAIALRRLLRTSVAVRWAERSPWSTAAAVAVVGLLASWFMQEQGLTEIVGALLVGIAVPARGWQIVMDAVGRVGRVLVPVFFVVTGVTLFGQFAAGPSLPVPWLLIGVVLVLAVVGKVVGRYVGVRWAGGSPGDGWRTGVLLNTRGLTELIVLKAGFTAGILTPAVYLAFVVMAVVTTAMTGPVHGIVDRIARRRETVAVDGGALRDA